MTFDRWLLLGAIGAAFIAVYLAGWWYRDCPRWFLGCACRDTDLPDGYVAPSSPVRAANRESADRGTDEWDDGREAYPDPGPPSRTLAEDEQDDQWADQLHAINAELHAPAAERTVTRDVWDEWWTGMDGLDRECLLVTRWRHREEGLWAALVAETRELCAA